MSEGAQPIGWLTPAECQHPSAGDALVRRSYCEFGLDIPQVNLFCDPWDDFVEDCFKRGCRFESEDLLRLFAVGYSLLDVVLKWLIARVAERNTGFDSLPDHLR